VLKFSIKTLGCKLNQYESNVIMDRLIAGGHSFVKFGSVADIVIINTCTVTDRSDKKWKIFVKQGAKSSLSGKVIVTGCAVNAYRERLLNQPEILSVYSNDEKELLITDILKSGSSSLPPLPKNRTRAFLKIQDGCDGKCSYCIVPSVRGLPRSRNFFEIIDEAKFLIDNNIPELVLTGITIGKYCFDDYDLADLAAAIAALPGNFRLRITSIEPLHLSDKLIDVYSNDKVCSHIHLPLQSGSDRILSIMSRPYNSVQFLHVVDNIKNRFPEIAIGSDIIVGFPTESVIDFSDSCNVAKCSAFSYIHQFSYSARQGTVSADMPDDPDKHEIKTRYELLKTLSTELSLNFRNRFINKQLSCVIEHKKNTGVYGLSDNYIKIITDNLSPSDVGSLKKITLLKNNLESFGTAI